MSDVHHLVVDGGDRRQAGGQRCSEGRLLKSDLLKHLFDCGDAQRAPPRSAFATAVARADESYAWGDSAIRRRCRVYLTAVFRCTARSRCVSQSVPTAVIAGSSPSRPPDRSLLGIRRPRHQGRRFDRIPTQTSCGLPSRRAAVRRYRRAQMPGLRLLTAVSPIPRRR